MPFKSILKQLVEEIHGASGAIFADGEGEAVEQYSLDEESYQLKCIGAHKGIIFNLIRETQKVLGKDDVESVTIRMENFDVIVASVEDEYYLAVTLEHGAVPGRAFDKIKGALKIIKKEM